MLQFNTNCEDVYGEIVEQLSSFDRVETGTARISFKANWNGTHNTADPTITGWLDGYDDFKLDQVTVIDGISYRDIPGLDIWPK